MTLGRDVFLYALWLAVPLTGCNTWIPEGIPYDNSSCASILASKPEASSAVYVLDPDGDGPQPEFSALCDMNGGGWTLIARFSNTEKTMSWVDSAQRWYDSVEEEGATTSSTVNTDMLGAGFWSVSAQELKLSRSDRLGNEHVVVTTDACVGGLTFRQKIESFGDWRIASWPDETVQGSCAVEHNGSIEEVQLTSGFGKYMCQGAKVGKIDGINFFAHAGEWNAVIMPGGVKGGAGGCGSAHNGIAVVADTPGTFGGTLGYQMDFGDSYDPSKEPLEQNYALNLWVR